MHKLKFTDFGIAKQHRILPLAKRLDPNNAHQDQTQSHFF